MADQATDTASAALLKLRNEVAGIIGLAEYELRQAVGNTNVNVLRLRLEEADAVLASLPAPTAPAMCACGHAEARHRLSVRINEDEFCDKACSVYLCDCAVYAPAAPEKKCGKGDGPQPCSYPAGHIGAHKG